MIDINELRRMASRSIGITVSSPVSPAGLIEILDRLEAAESEAIEQARLNGIGAERELALMAKLEVAEKERDALRARVERMEKQEPVGEVLEHYGFTDALVRFTHFNMEQLPIGTVLYTLPGAKGE